MASNCSPNDNKGLVDRKKVSKREYHEIGKEELTDLPLRFSTSEAKKGAQNANLGIGFKVEGRSKPKYETDIVAVSLAAFLIYFCILREENDIDDLFTTEPKYYERVQGLERSHLESAIVNYTLEGRDTKELEERLAVVIARDLQTQQQ